jgi:hypothetical protein
MDWTEIVHLRSYTRPDRDEAVAAFHQLTLPDQEMGLGDIVLLRDTALDNDLCIMIHWRGEATRRDKSPLGLQLASAFSEFGQIHHSMWVQEGRVPRKARRRTGDEKRKS